MVNKNADKDPTKKVKYILFKFCVFSNCRCAQAETLISLSRCCHSLVVVLVPDYSLLKISSFSIPDDRNGSPSLHPL